MKQYKKHIEHTTTQMCFGLCTTQCVYCVVCCVCVQHTTQTWSGFVFVCWRCHFEAIDLNITMVKKIFQKKRFLKVDTKHTTHVFIVCVHNTRHHWTRQSLIWTRVSLSVFGRAEHDRARNFWKKSLLRYKIPSTMKRS